MSNLLSSIAAAAGSMLKRNSPDPLDIILKPSVWIYRNLCWYGMQIQRYSRRIFRTVHNGFKPIARKAVGAYVRYIRRPAKTTAACVKEIAADCPYAFSLIKKTHKEAGFLGAADTFFYAVSRGIVRHRTFLRSVVNYVLPIISILVLILTASSLFGRSYALSVQYNGVTVGCIQDESTYNQATELVSQRVISSSEDFLQALNPTYSLVKTDGTNFNTPDEICNNILLNTDSVEDAYGFFVDGELVAATRSRADMDYILEEFLEQFRTGAANETVEFVGETDIVSGLYSTEMIISSADFRSAISQTVMQSQLYTVKKNDTLQKILKSYSLTEERFLELNPDFDGNLKAGTSVLVEKEQPVLRVKSVIVSSYEKTIAYSTETIKDPTQYTSYKKLKTAGKNGLEYITQEVTYIDGVKISTEIVSREVITEPVNEVYVVGTKKATTANNNGGSNINVQGTGRFTWPLPGVNTVSSKFGWRAWSNSYHKGIDISTKNVNGRTIVAADAGKVTAVRYQANGYGKYLIIDHGNGYTTLYAHCSAILVSQGQTVSKGQAIAKVGSTGRSSGPHLHFEIRVNGVQKDPLGWYR